MEEGGKKGEASTYVDRLKRMYGNGQSTLCLVYNATGDALRLVDDHDWYGYVDGRVEYPSEIGNGQWAAFLHVHRAGETSGSVSAVVYRGKKEDGQDRDYLLAWSTPWGFYYRNKEPPPPPSISIYRSSLSSPLAPPLQDVAAGSHSRWEPPGAVAAGNRRRLMPQPP